MNVQEPMTVTHIVESELDSLAIRNKFWLRIASDPRWYERSILPKGELLQKLSEKGIDVFTFRERSWCCKTLDPEKSWAKAEENIALLHLKSYDEWWNNVGKKTRNMIRKAEKSGIRTSIVEPNDKLAEGMWKIYNETPVRQERGFRLFGITLHRVKTSLHPAQNRIYIGAHFQDELVGFIQLVHGDNLTTISQILSLKKHWDKAINNALIARAIEVCASKGVKWIMYGSMGDFSHPSLDKFKQSNGFSRFQLTRYYIPVTRKGRLTIRLGLHKEVKERLPPSIQLFSIPVYNWLSRSKMRIRLYMKPGTAA